LKGPKFYPHQRHKTDKNIRLIKKLITGDDGVDKSWNHLHFWVPYC